MNKRYNIWGIMLALAALLLLGSCGSEDTPEVSFVNPSIYFQPADSDLSQTAALRRTFYQQTGCFLLFNDTLQHRLLGTDINGDNQYFTETVDMTYNVGQTNTSSTSYTYTYLSTYDEQKQVVDFLNNYVLNHLTKQIRPFSFFICRQIVGVNNLGTTLRPYAASNQRCTAIAAYYLLQRERTEEQKLNYAKTIINAMIGQMAQNNSDDFTTFYSYSGKYYGANFSAAGITTSSITTDQLRKLGFLSSATGLSYLPSQDTDITAYTLLVLQYTDAQIQSMYTNYDIIIKKAAEMRSTLIKLGYVF
jgi:hypothetical protein